MLRYSLDECPHVVADIPEPDDPATACHLTCTRCGAEADIDATNLDKRELALAFSTEVLKHMRCSAARSAGGISN